MNSSGPVDILSMLNKAQAKCNQQNSVTAFFNGFSNDKPSAATKIDSLEEIERQMRRASVKSNGESMQALSLSARTSLKLSRQPPNFSAQRVQHKCANQVLQRQQRQSQQWIHQLVVESTANSCQGEIEKQWKCEQQRQQQKHCTTAARLQGREAAHHADDAAQLEQGEEPEEAGQSGSPAHRAAAAEAIDESSAHRSGAISNGDG